MKPDNGGARAINNAAQGIIDGVYLWLESNDWEYSSHNYTLDPITYNDVDQTWEFGIHKMNRVIRDRALEWAAANPGLILIRYNRRQNALTLGYDMADFALLAKLQLHQILGG